MAYDIFVSNSYAYIADGSSGLWIIDVSNPSSPRVVGSYDTPGTASGIFIFGSYAYVADWTAGLRIIDISNPSSPYEVGSYDTPGWAWDIFVSNSYAYVADGDSGFRIIDISSPSSPYQIGFYDTPADNYKVFVSSHLAYTIDGGNLRIIDIANPSSPYQIGYYNTPSYARGIFVSDSFSYVADGNAGLQIYQFLGSGIKERLMSNAKRPTPEIYPNPASSFFVIPSSLLIKEIKIFDASGKLIKEIALSSSNQPKISLKGIRSGLYILKIKARDKEFTQKLIIR